MRRVFFSNLLYIVVLNLLVKPLWVLGIDREVQNTVGHGEYGLYFALFNLSFVFNILVDMGLTYHNGRTVAGNPMLLNTLYARAVALKAMLAVVYMAASLVAGFIWGIDAHAFVWLIVLCLSQVVQSFTLYFRSNLSGLHRYRLDSTVSITDRVLMIALFGAVLLSPLRERFTIEWFVYGQLFCYLCAMILACVLNKRLGATFTGNVSWQSLQDLFRSSYPYALVVLFMSVYYRSDGIMLERWVSNTEAGVYAAGYRLFDATNQFGFLFSGLLIPMFARLLATKEKVQELAESGFGALFTFTTIAACASLAYRNEIMHLLYVDSNPYQANVFAAIMCALPGSAAVFIYGTLLSVSGHLRTLNMLTGAAAAFNVLVNLWAIPRFGALGAACTATATHALIGVAEIIVCSRVFVFERFIALSLRLFVLTAGSLALFYACRVLEIHWITGLALGLSTSLALAGLAGTLQVQQLIRAVRLKAAR